MQPGIHAIKDRLLQGLDGNYNVVDMGIVLEVISQLESYPITKEALEATRLGKDINELRRRASDKKLASRLKSLLKKWRELLNMPAAGGTGSGTATPVQNHAPSNHNSVGVSGSSNALQQKAVVAAAAQRLNGHAHIGHAHPQKILNSSQPSSRLTSPAVSSSSRLSPALGGVANSMGPGATVGPTSKNSSSMPSSASSSPGLSSSRPATPINQIMNNSRPVSPAVPKTNAANKRLRKAIDDAEEQFYMQPAAKKAKNNHSAEPEITSPMVNGGVAEKGGVNCDNNGANHKKKLTRKKQLEQEREHLLEQKLLTARRQSSKVRTTQELVQELALRTATSVAPVNNLKSVNSGSGTLVANETKTELMNRFFDSQQSNGHHQNVLSPPLSDGPPSPKLLNGHAETEVGAPARESVEDILAQLPPIDVASVLAEINSEMQNDQSEEDDEEELEEIDGLIGPPVKKVDKKDEPLSEGVKAAMVEELHTGHHESVNGNFNHDGNFKEWHEVVTKETVNGDLLYILPYSVID